MFNSNNTHTYTKIKEENHDFFFKKNSKQNTHTQTVFLNNKSTNKMKMIRRQKEICK